MKIMSLLIILVFLFSLGTVVSAQETELPSPGWTPDSPLYFLETIVEEVITFFTFGDLKKTERHALLAAERIAEAKAVIEKGKPESAKKALERYEDQLDKSAIRAEKAMNEGKDFETVMAAIAKAGKTTSVHLGVLAGVYEKVPEEGKAAVENAMAASIKRHGKAVEALKASNHLGEVPEEVPISTKIPEEAKERIQRRVQTKLMIEQALQVSESPRELCVESGTSQEMCEMIPARGFKSFEAIRTFCAEVGGPPEMCAALEPMCRELGVTKPDECFRVLMISSAQAYQAAELEFVPAPTLPEE